jgi:hypothetical protein
MPQMSLDVLIYTPEASVAAALSAAARRLRWNPLSIDRAGAGLNLLRGRKYPAVIIDCVDPATSSGLLELCRRSLSNKTSVVFALAEERDAAINRNASFVVKRSTYARDLAPILHAADGLVRQEFRRYRRIPIDLPVMLSNEEHRLQLTSLNLSEGGMCIKGEVKGWNREHVIQFRHPKVASELRTKSSVIWSEFGKTGMRFQGMSAAIRVLLGDWLGQYE